MSRYIRKGPSAKVKNPLASEKITATGIKRLYYTTKEKFDTVVSNFASFEQSGGAKVEKNRNLVQSIYSDIENYEKTKNPKYLKNLSSAISRNIQKARTHNWISQSMIQPMESDDLYTTLSKQIHEELKTKGIANPLVDSKQIENIPLSKRPQITQVGLRKIVSNFFKKRNPKEKVILLTNIFLGEEIHSLIKNDPNILPVYLFSSS